MWCVTLWESLVPNITIWDPEFCRHLQFHVNEHQTPSLTFHSTNMTFDPTKRVTIVADDRERWVWRWCWVDDNDDPGMAAKGWKVQCGLLGLLRWRGDELVLSTWGNLWLPWIEMIFGGELELGLRSFLNTPFDWLKQGDCGDASDMIR